MMAYRSQPLRPAAIAATVAVAALLMTALVEGLSAGGYLARPEAELASFAVAPPPPPPPPERLHPRPAVSHRAPAKAAPEGRRAKPTPLVLPPPLVRPPLPPPPVQVALTRGAGTASHAGAGMTGNGTGAGGVGNGTGSGGDGNGDGGGETPPRWRHGDLSTRDWPHELGPITRDVSVGVRYTVNERGRVSRCAVTRSSGEPLLDQITCDLIMKRFRYEPSRDADGRPVSADIVETHTWGPERGDQADAE